jgi:hypothetical protein
LACPKITRIGIFLTENKETCIMGEPQSCPYCGVRLTSGKGGNTRGCLACAKLVCTRCTQHGVCKIHIDSAAPEQIHAYRRNYQSFCLFMSLGILIPYLFLMTSLLWESVFPEVVLYIAVFGMIPWILLNVVLIRKRSVKQAQKIFTQNDFVKNI